RRLAFRYPAAPAISQGRAQISQSSRSINNVVRPGQAASLGKRIAGSRRTAGRFQDLEATHLPPLPAAIGYLKKSKTIFMSADAGTMPHELASMTRRHASTAAVSRRSLAASRTDQTTSNKWLWDSAEHS